MRGTRKAVACVSCSSIQSLRSSALQARRQASSAAASAAAGTLTPAGATAREPGPVAGAGMTGEAQHWGVAGGHAGMVFLVTAIGAVIVLKRMVHSVDGQ